MLYQSIFYKLFYIKFLAKHSWLIIQAISDQNYN